MLVPVAGKVIGDIVLRKLVKPQGTVVEMGNQTYSISQEVMNQLLDSFQKNPDVTSSYRVSLQQLEGLSHMKAATKPKEANLPLAEDFYKALGFSSYQTIDINNDFGAMVMDLNKDITAEYNFHTQYDLVTNIGVSEHLLNQNNFFKNSHDLTAANGLMLHILPFLGYINHGFFNYEPRLFLDLAAANGYEVINLLLADRNGVVMDLTKQNETLTHFHHYLEALVPNEYHNGFVVSVMRKVNKNPFVVPLQGKYIQDIGDKELEGRYGERGNIGVVYPPPKGFFLLTKDNSLRLRLKRRILRILTKVVRTIVVSF